jgi:putative ABC transport system permease protein
MSYLPKPTPAPPRWAERFLGWFCAPHLLEEIQGDLYEAFLIEHKKNGLGRARLWYIREVLGFIKPFAIRRKPSPYSAISPIHPTMIRNYFNIAFRNLSKNRLFASLNVFGLTIGTICCLYILFYVQDERSYDLHHQAAGRLYRVTTELQNAGATGEEFLNSCSPPIALAAKAELPEVETATRMVNPGLFGIERYLFKVGDRVFYEKTGYLVDSTFFKTFDYHFIAGNPAKTLDAPQSIVISEALAIKLFDTPYALNKTINITGQLADEVFKVTGVFNGKLGNTHLMPDFFMPMNSRGLGDFTRQDNTWAGNNFAYTYLKLRPDSDIKALENKLNALLEKRGGDQLRHFKMKKSLHLQPVTAIHTSAAEGKLDVSKGTSERFLNMLLLIAGFIQLVACINFMNLSTARSTRRAKEVGVRKTVGASRSALVAQFLSESMVMTLLAVGMAVPLVILLLPWLNEITGADFRLNLVQNGWNWTIVLGLALLTGVIAGSYPAFYLSSFNPLSIFRGMKTSNSGSGAVFLRKGLVVSQFVIASVLIIGALVVQQQLSYLLQQDMGFDKNQKMIFSLQMVQGSPEVETFRNRVSALPEIKALSGMSAYPGQFVPNDISLYPEGGNMNSSSIVRFAFTDEYFLKTLKIDLLAGRNFLPQDTAVTLMDGRVILNETALKKLGIPIEKAPGMVVKSDRADGSQFQYTIVGVMKDINFERMSETVDPYMVYASQVRNLPQVIADVNADDYAALIKKVQVIWSEMFPNIPFEYKFLDQEVANLYQSEQIFSRIVNAFTMIAILISCLGLFGLAVFAAEQRTKEIGIRKVLGASVGNLTALLAKDFVVLVLVAIVIASPIAWYLMQQWLDDFAYHIQIEWWLYLLAGGIAVLVAFLTVCTQSIRLARTNPIQSLRSE